jgi:hypothetical protein
MENSKRFIMGDIDVNSFCEDLKEVFEKHGIAGFQANENSILGSIPGSSEPFQITGFQIYTNNDH